MQGTRRVVVIEDNPGDIFLLRHALNEHGLEYEMVVAEEGEHALDYFRGLQNDAKNLPDLIVLDLNLPGWDGIALLERIKSLSGPLPPVVVLTSSDSPSDRQRATAAGVREFVTKPSQLDEFLSLGKHLKLLALGQAGPS